MTDAEFLGRFEGLTLPETEWTHRAHMRLAFLCLREAPLGAAIARVRRGIQAFNAHRGVEEGPLSGYNETTTQAFVRLVAATMAAYGETFPTPDSEAFCDAHPQLMSRHVLRLYYSPEGRMRPQAKATFVEPDLAPLPRILSDRQAVRRLH